MTALVIPDPLPWTPGPWRYADAQVPRVMAIGTGHSVAGVHNIGRYTGGNRTLLRANGCLLAAAPDLFHVLRLLRDGCNDAHLAHAADLALAKALGA